MLMIDQSQLTIFFLLGLSYKIHLSSSVMNLKKLIKDKGIELKLHI